MSPRPNEWPSWAVMSGGALQKWSLYPAVTQPIKLQSQVLRRPQLSGASPSVKPHCSALHFVELPPKASTSKRPSMRPAIPAERIVLASSRGHWATKLDMLRTCLEGRSSNPTHHTRPASGFEVEAAALNARNIK